MKTFTRIFLAFFVSQASVFCVVQHKFELDTPLPGPIIQGDPSGVLSFKVDRTHGDDGLNKVRFTLPTTYKVDASTAPPASWTVYLGPDIGMGANVVEFRTSVSSAEIKTGTQIFDIVVTGSGGGPIPNAAADDNTHTLSNVEAWESDGEVSANDPPGQFTSRPWLRRGLFMNFYIDPTSVAKDEVVPFVLEVQNRTTGSKTVSTTMPVKSSRSGSGTFTYISGPDFSSQTLAAGEIKTFTYQFKGNKSGTARYESTASGGGATTDTVASNEVAVGPVGGWMVVPLYAANNENIPLEFHVVNNTTHAITNLDPKPVNYSKKNGLSNPVLVSGPNPPGPVPLLDPGAEIVFKWVYKVSGPPGSQYLFTCRVVSDEEDTNRDQSDWGTIVTFDASLDPATATIGASGVTFSFTLNNGALVSDKISKVTIFHPNATFQQSPPHYISGSATGGNASSWTKSATPTGDGIVFTAPVGDELKGLQTMTLTLGYNIPNASYYPNDANLKFNVKLEGTVSAAAYKETKNLSFSITKRSLAIEVIPAPPSLAPYWNADGASTCTLRARLMNGTTPMAGKSVNFGSAMVDPAAAILIPPQVTPEIAVTDVGGYALTTMIAPRYENASPPQVEATASASYMNVKATTPKIKYQYYTLPALKITAMDAKQGSSGWLPVTQFEFLPGDANAVTFRPTLMVVGSQLINVKKTGSSFAFTDKENNGILTYSSNLSQDYNNIPGWGSQALVFDPVVIPSGFLYGHYSPTITLKYSNSSGVLQSTPITLQVTQDTQKVSVGSKNQGIQIINWRETLEKVQS